MVRFESSSSNRNSVAYPQSSMEAVTGCPEKTKITYLNTSIQMINENGDIEILITEENDEILEGFTLKARRKRLRRLKMLSMMQDI